VIRPHYAFRRITLDYFRSLTYSYAYQCNVELRVAEKVGKKKGENGRGKGERRRWKMGNIR
jgi:hypothetical protein